MGIEQTVAAVQQALINTFTQLDEYFELSQTERTFKLDSDSWSIDEILEHVSLTSHFLLMVIRKGRDKALKRAQSSIPANLGNSLIESHLDAMAAIGHPDAFKWIRPEHMEPSRSKTSTEIRETLHTQYQECLDILQQLKNGEGTLHKVRMSVQNLGKLDMYEWLYFLAQHGKRHALEIERIKASIKQTPSSNL